MPSSATRRRARRRRVSSRSDSTFAAAVRLPSHILGVMVPLKKSTRQSILALVWCAAVMSPLQVLSADAPPDAAAGVAHPALWPRSHSVGLVDEATESLVSDLMRRMSPE